MASQGPLYPGTVTTEVGPSGDNDWTNPGNIGADDGSEAQITAATYDSGDHSYRLKAQNFGFTIPSGSTIDGIVVEIEQRRFAGAAVDQEVRLIDDQGSLNGDDKASATAWPGTATIRTYGGTTDTWNLAPAISSVINDPDFGVAHIVAATAANTDIGVDFVRVTVHYTPPSASPTRGQISFAALETPLVPTRGRLSWAEFETPIAPTRGRLSWAEFETPSAPTRGQVSFAEFEVPFQATRGRISFAELEVPIAPTRGLISWTEFEAPSIVASPTRGRVSWAELEAPFQATRGRISFAELEVPIAPTRGRISFAEFETPIAPTRGRVSFAVLDVETAPTRGLISFAELELSDSGSYAYHVCLMVYPGRMMNR